MDTSFERVAFCTLNRIFGFSPGIAHAMIDALGSASAVFSLDREKRRALLGPGSKYLSQLSAEALEQSRRELEWLAAEGYGLVTLADEAYPPLLRACSDAPLCLYLRSVSPPAELFGARPAVAVVGTRDISPYGREWCERLVDALARTPEKPSIVSGLAIGVDITAHAAALDGGLPTLAVMATGIDGVYPARHRRAAERIAQTPGCALVTDYPPGTAPLAIHFLRRNRIIAGLARATLLVESRCKGGGMMTARLAFSYDRDVFALPGRADDLRSGGCNQLIREKVAEAVSDEGSFVAALGFGRPARSSRAGLEAELEARFAAGMPAGEFAELLAVAQAVRERRGSTPDELCGRTGLGYAAVSRCLTLLESEGLVSADLLRRYSIRRPRG